MMFLYLFELNILFEDNPPSPCLDCFVCSSVCFASAGMEPTTNMIRIGRVSKVRLLEDCESKTH